MATNDQSWLLEQETLVLRGDWLREQVAAVLPLLPKTGIVAIDMQAVTQVDSSLMTVLLKVRGQSKQVRLRGVSAKVGSLLTLYQLDTFFAQDGVIGSV